MSKSLARLRHDRSKKDFPGLKLDSDEYVELVFGRAKNNLLFILGCIAAATVLTLGVFLLIVLVQPSLSSLATSLVFVLLLLIVAVALVANLLAFFIHRGNRLFITNKRFILSSIRFPWVRSEHSTELCDVRGVSFSEDSLILQLLHYGTLKLATAKSVYEFHDTNITREDLSAINEAVVSATPPESAPNPEDAFQDFEI